MSIDGSVTRFQGSSTSGYLNVQPPVAGDPGGTLPSGSDGAMLTYDSASGGWVPQVTTLSAGTDTFANQGSNSVTFGTNATTLGANATVAIGQNASALGSQAVSIGLNSSVTVAATNAVAIGNGASALGDSCAALGPGAVAGSASNNNAFAFSGSAIGDGSIALGVLASSVGDGAVAIGQNAQAGPTSSLALGDQADVNGISEGISLNATGSLGDARPADTAHAFGLGISPLSDTAVAPSGVGTDHYLGVTVNGVLYKILLSADN